MPNTMGDTCYKCQLSDCFRCKPRMRARFVVLSSIEKGIPSPIVPPDVGSVSIEYLLFYTNVADVLLHVVPAKAQLKQTAPRATNQSTIF